MEQGSVRCGNREPRRPKVALAKAVTFVMGILSRGEKKRMGASPPTRVTS